MRRPVSLPFAQELEDQRVRGGEDLRALHAQGGQFVDVEEAAIVDLVGGDAPERQAIRLLVEQLIEQIEAVRLVGVAVEQRDDRRRRDRGPRRCCRSGRRAGA